MFFRGTGPGPEADSALVTDTMHCCAWCHIRSERGSGLLRCAEPGNGC